MRNPRTNRIGQHAIALIATIAVGDLTTDCGSVNGDGQGQDAGMEGSASGSSSGSLGGVDGSTVGPGMDGSTVGPGMDGSTVGPGMDASTGPGKDGSTGSGGDGSTDSGRDGSTGFTVTAAGFKDPRGRAFFPKGINATPGEFMAAWPNMQNNLPGMNFVRLVCDSSYSDGRFAQTLVDQAIATITGAGIVVEYEDHGGPGASGAAGSPYNTAWYQMMIGKYKNNPLVFCELPNEPSTGTVIQDQIALINAIRAAGHTNPIGLMSYAGYLPDNNIPQVLASVGTNQIYGLIHIYGWGSSATPSTTAFAANYGIYGVCDEFGGSVDGSSEDASAVETITNLISGQQAGQIGAVFWYIENPQVWDSVYLNPANWDSNNPSTWADGSTFTGPGSTYIQPWLSGTRVAQP